jgi:hypothetical protein
MLKYHTPKKLQALIVRDNVYQALHWVSVDEASLQKNRGTTTRCTRPPGAYLSEAKITYDG